MACLPDDRGEMLIDGLGIEGVDRRGRGRASGGHDLRGHGFELRHAATGKEDLRAVTRKGARNRAADMTACPIDDRVFAFKQHTVSSLADMNVSDSGRLPGGGSATTAQTSARL